MTRLDQLEALLRRHPACLRSADLAARLGRRRSGNPATLAQVTDLVWRCRQRGTPIETLGRPPHVRYRLVA